MLSSPALVGGVPEGDNSRRSHTQADDIRFTTWGPKTVFFVKDPSSSADKKGGGGGEKKTHDEAEKKTRFEKVVFTGSEEVQTTETTEALLEGGGAVKRTWVVVSRVVVQAVEREVERNEVVVEG